MISLLRHFGASRAAASGSGDSRVLRGTTPASSARRSFTADQSRVPALRRSIDASKSRLSAFDPMKSITSLVVRAIAFCTHYARWVIAGAVLLAIVSAWYAATHFAMTTDINQLISSDSPARQRELAFEKAFPQFDTTIAVVDAPTPELVQAATGALAAKLSNRRTCSARSRNRRAGPLSPRTVSCSCRPISWSGRPGC